MNVIEWGNQLDLNRPYCQVAPVTSKMLRTSLSRRAAKIIGRNLSTDVHYEQGQSPEPKIREYFYYIDHQGQLFMDDAKMKNFTSCHKEQKFLEFFFQRLEVNETGRYEDSFPFISRCGRERNFIRCDDRPIVYLDLKASPVSYNPDRFTYGFANSEKLRSSFFPDKLYMHPESGRVYHPADPEFGGVALIKSSLGINLSQYFHFDNGENNPPTSITWRGVTYDLTYEIAPLMDKPPAVGREMAVELVERNLHLKAPEPSSRSN